MKVLITGITGQDGSYLTDELIEQGHEVHGIRRRSSSFNTGRIEHIYQDPHVRDAQLFLHYADMTDSSSLSRIIERVEPDQIYNLAAQSHVAVSFEEPEYTGEADALGVTRLLEILRRRNWQDIPLYQASTSEIFGSSPGPQNESTLFAPQSPYAAAKLYAYWIVRNYRSAFNLRVSNGILFNHESPRRGETFVTRKITMALARARVDKECVLYLGNLDSIRDWGHARDFVKGMMLINNHHTPDDFVLATGQSHTVREFLQIAAKIAGFDLEFQGTGVKEEAIDLKTGRVIMRIDPVYFRPNEVPFLMGDFTKARELLGWFPQIGFSELVSEMMESDIKKLETPKFL